MKHTFLFVGFACLLLGCKDKTIHCINIGDKVKPWSVYQFEDTIHLADGAGNDTSIIVSHFHDSEPYTRIESGGLMKKEVDCEHEQQFSSDQDFFLVFITKVIHESVKDKHVITRTPSVLSFVVKVGDASAQFRVNRKSNMAENPDINTFHELNYTVGNTTYDEVILCKKDTSQAAVNVYHFVYARDKGLVQFSTRYPHKTWTIQ